MTPEEAADLGNTLRDKRQQAGLSAREVARRAGVSAGTVTRIELGQIPRPQPDSLRAIAAVLDIPAADLFAATDWPSLQELPSFKPYLRAKYADLPPDAIAELENHFQAIAKQYGTDGPQDGEDER